MYDYLRKAVQQFPEKIAIKYKDVELSYSELDDVIKKIADECFADIERCNIGIVVNSPMNWKSGMVYCLCGPSVLV